LKAVCKTTKHAPKIITLRGVDTVSVNSRGQLRKVIREQLQDDLAKEFDVGYYEGSTVVSIRSPRDLAELWNDLKAGKKVILWCDGLKEDGGKNKRKQVEVDSEESDDEEADFQKRPGNKKRKYKLKDKKLEKIESDLKEQHGSTYTALQYRTCIWAELIDSELANASEPPEALQGAYGVRVHVSTVCLTLKFTRQVIRHVALQQSEAMRTKFMAEVSIL
jgi:hypothetical protein